MISDDRAARRVDDRQVFSRGETFLRQLGTRRAGGSLAPQPTIIIDLRAMFRARRPSQKCNCQSLSSLIYCAVNEPKQVKTLE